ncbi:integrase catalytic domain-containing protein [Trichonephila clavipes]|nr:integrase catalytic domain-containing protein [Trichonephila clavipes]
MIKLPDHTLAEFLTNESIEWNFIPPRSPNHGGLWEAGVKAFKFHLKRVVGNAHLTLEEFITILCEIEAVLNSRPLTPLTSNFDDFETLTPGHFLVGRPLTSIVEPQITNINENQLSRWERVKKITQHIYKLWKRDYLNNLQERHKWKFNKNNVSVGTLVLIKDENLPSTKWSTGRITEIFPGTDGKVRVVNLRMPNGNILKRTIRNLCILPHRLVAAVVEWSRYRIVAGLVMSSSPVPLKTRRVGQRCTLNLSRAQTSSRWCGVVVRRGMPAQVSSTSLDHGSKSRGPSPKALV